MRITVKNGTELNVHELYEVLKLRIDVFTVEQDCPYQDLDGQDLGAEFFHIMFHHDNKLAAYVRVMYNDPKNEQVQIGRVVVAKDYRGISLGKDLMTQALKLIQEGKRMQTAMLHGQSHLKKFYESFGFEVSGDEFLEDGIPHLLMVKRL